MHIFSPAGQCNQNQANLLAPQAVPNPFFSCSQASKCDCVYERVCNM